MIQNLALALEVETQYRNEPFIELDFKSIWHSNKPNINRIPACPLPFTPAPAVRQSFLVSPIEGATVTYYCSGGFEGDETNFTNTCLDGNWTMDSLPVCKSKIFPFLLYT